MSEPEGRGAAWTEERGTSDEGRRRLKAPRRRAEEAESVDNASFRRAAGQFASGIVVVTTRGGHAMTVSAFTSVSLDPPLVLFCAEKIARFHDAVLAEGSWAVSILAEDDEKTARWLATRGRPLDGQLDGVACHPGPATGAPLLDDALAVLECRTTAVHDAGDHTIVVGEVEAVTAPPETPSETPDRGPLLHYSGAYRRLRSLAPGDLFDPVQAPVQVGLADH
jgi:flavin reductase (DIM6/NTAB) family NADH-FMN oxidoreductase RutF